MDQIDRKIVALLERDASIRNADLANRVGLAASSCLRRVWRLKQAGVIKRIVAITDPAAMGRGLKVMVTTKLADHTASARTEWVEQLRSDPAVAQAYAVSGDVDVVVVLAVPDTADFQKATERLFRKNANVTQFHSMFLLETYKE